MKKAAYSHWYTDSKSFSRLETECTSVLSIVQCNRNVGHEHTRSLSLNTTTTSEWKTSKRQERREKNLANWRGNIFVALSTQRKAIWMKCRQLPAITMLILKLPFFLFCTKKLAFNANIRNYECKSHVRLFSFSFSGSSYVFKWNQLEDERKILQLHYRCTATIYEKWLTFGWRHGHHLQKNADTQKMVWNLE